LQHVFVFLKRHTSPPCLSMRARIYFSPFIWPTMNLSSLALMFHNHRPVGSATHKRIVRVCEEILEGQHEDQFRLHVWMTGSGGLTKALLGEPVTRVIIQSRGRGAHVLHRRCFMLSRRNGRHPDSPQSRSCVRAPIPQSTCKGGPGTTRPYGVPGRPPNSARLPGGNPCRSNRLPSGVGRDDTQLEAQVVLGNPLAGS
jgi:hypothetical protein